jgi:hypothetical protein
MFKLFKSLKNNPIIKDCIKAYVFNKNYKQYNSIKGIYIDVPGDGSCLYHCIAKALEECRDLLDAEFTNIINGYILSYLCTNNEINIDEINDETCKLHIITSDIIPMNVQILSKLDL